MGNVTLLKHSSRLKNADDVKLRRHVKTTFAAKVTTLKKGPIGPDGPRREHREVFHRDDPGLLTSE